MTATIVVETYVPGTEPDAMRRAAGVIRLRVEQAAREGVPVRYLGALLLPADDTCFHLVEGPSAETVRQATSGSDLPGLRITQAVLVAARCVPRSAGSSKGGEAP